MFPDLEQLSATVIKLKTSNAQPSWTDVWLWIWKWLFQMLSPYSFSWRIAPTALLVTQGATLIVSTTVLTFCTLHRGFHPETNKLEFFRRCRMISKQRHSNWNRNNGLKLKGPNDFTPGSKSGSRLVYHSKQYHRKVVLNIFYFDSLTSGIHSRTHKLEPPCVSNVRTPHESIAGLAFIWIITLTISSTDS